MSQGSGSNKLGCGITITLMSLVVMFIAFVSFMSCTDSEFQSFPHNNPGIPCSGPLTLGIIGEFGLLIGIGIIILDVVGKFLNKKSAEINVQEGNIFEVKLGDYATVRGNFVVANQITESFNKIDAANSANELKNLLKELTIAVGKMTEVLTAEEGERIARALDTLVDEATSQKPDRQWWQLSVDSLKKAAENVGNIGKPVLDIIARLIPILTSISMYKR